MLAVSNTAITPPAVLDTGLHLSSIRLSIPGQKKDLKDLSSDSSRRDFGSNQEKLVL